MTEHPGAPAGAPGDATADDHPAAPATSDRPTEAPPPASQWVQEHEPPDTEAERQVQETIRSVSRLEESN